MPTSSRFGLNQLVEGQASGETKANEYLGALEIVTNGKVLDRDLTAPPGSPVNGDLYIVAAAPTGAWTGQAAKFAYYLNGWKFITPQSGMIVFVHDEKVPFMYSAVESLWFPFGLSAPYWSTTEYFTGTYRQGQKIYAKVIAITPVANVVTSTAHSITGLATGRGVTFVGFGEYTGNSFPVSQYFSFLGTSMELWCDATNLHLYCGAVAPTSIEVLITYAKS